MRSANRFSRFPVRLVQRAALALATLLLAPSAFAGGFDQCVDVALVLALDGSDSVDAREYQLQQQAIAYALRDREVLNAFARAGTVAVAVIVWGDARHPVDDIDAVTIRDGRDAERLARAVERQPRRARGTTGLGAGLAAALNRLTAMGCAHRSVVNVSGDGKETIMPRRQRIEETAEQARNRAQAWDVTINALVISGATPGLARYYAQKIITGPEAFVMEIASYDDINQALKRKLMREVAPAMVSWAD